MTSHQKNIDNGFRQEQLAKIQQLAQVLQEQNLTEIHYKDADFEITLHKSALSNMILPEHQIDVETKTRQIHEKKGKHVKIEGSRDLDEMKIDTEDVTVTSNLIGTVYLASSPEAESFVTVGSRVEQDDVLCLIECMKTMNRIKAPCAGIVKAILISNEQAVDYAKPLIVIQKM